MRVGRLVLLGALAGCGEVDIAVDALADARPRDAAAPTDRGAAPPDAAVRPDRDGPLDLGPDTAPDAAVDPGGDLPLITHLGGRASVEASGPDAFRVAAPDLDGAARRAFTIGEALFEVDWVPEPGPFDDRDGLGPLFHATACQSCHPRAGRGAPPTVPEQTPIALLFRLGAAGPDPVYGDQLQTRAIADLSPEVVIRVEATPTAGAFDDGAPFTLIAPRYGFSAWSQRPPEGELVVSPRVASPLIGLGLLEAVPEAQIVAFADPDDLDGDGISGRANRVLDVEAGQAALGRFGWKANQPSLRQQNAAALSGDMGLTSVVFPDEICTAAQVECQLLGLDDEPEVSPRALDGLTAYTRFLAVPVRPDPGDPRVRTGQALFHGFGCAACHRPSMTTGAVADAPALSEQTIWPYTDLLLHDMGPELADGRPDGLADGREWRTPPLWGLGLTAVVSGHTRLLHDGRARSIAEAILWHGGEGAAAREAFRSAPADAREALIGFLESL